MSCRCWPLWLCMSARARARDNERTTDCMYMCTCAISFSPSLFHLLVRSYAQSCCHVCCNVVGSKSVCCMLQRDRFALCVLCIHVMDNSSTLYELNGNNKNNARERRKKTSSTTAGETAPRMFTVPAIRDRRRCTVWSQIAILYKWSNQVLHVRCSYAMYTLLDSTAPTKSAYVCWIICSQNHLHESIERLRYTDHSTNKALSIWPLPWQLMSLIESLHNLRSCCEKHFSYRSSFSSNTDTC